MKGNNPIITGFNPDPCIIRVNEDFYMATSTFEWFPGVQLYHSKDLINWRQLPHPVQRMNQLNMVGNDSSGGVWAPQISYHEGLFYLVYSNVRNVGSAGIFRDFSNFLITTDNIESGVWSDPIFLTHSGFDASLFHDIDGKKYLLNTRLDYRYFYNDDKYRLIRGIIIQEYSVPEKKLVGEVKEIFLGTELLFTEAPHLLFKNNYYYLITAEGGTGYNHAITIARSKNILGPYEVHPNNPILTSKGDYSLYLQKSGHGMLVDDQFGNWYISHLCSRPIGREMNVENYQKEKRLLRCILGRETAIQNIVWKNDWPYLSSMQSKPSDTFDTPFDTVQKDFYADYKTDFMDGVPIEFSTLRTPLNDDVIRISKDGLVMRGQESPVSKHYQSVLGFRQKHFSFEAETSFSFEPQHYSQMAGMMYRYDESNFYFLYKYYNNEEESCYLNLLLMDQLNASFPLGDGIRIDSKKVDMKLVVSNDKAQFFIKKDDWIEIGSELDATVMSDENHQSDAFTGSFVTLNVHDFNNHELEACFHYFEYKKI